MIVSNEEISLRLSSNGNKIHLEAALSGDVESDYIFLYIQKPFDLGHKLPEGFRMEETGQGTLAWTYDVPTDNLEKILVQLGSILLG